MRKKHKDRTTKEEVFKENIVTVAGELWMPEAQDRDRWKHLCRPSACSEERLKKKHNWRAVSGSVLTHSKDDVKVAQTEADLLSISLNVGSHDQLVGGEIS